MHPWEDDNWLPGVLSNEQLLKLIAKGYISGLPHLEGIDKSSIDLHLSDEGYKMLEGSIKPFGSNSYEKILTNDKLRKKLDKEQDGTFNLKKGFCYVFKLKEKLCNLSNTNIYGQATAKSTVGRLDVIARLIVDGMYQYEQLDPASLKSTSGDMYIEIMPISFNIKVKEDVTLSQLRLFHGKINDSIINDEKFIKGLLHGSEDGYGFLSVNISNTNIGGLKVVAFRANKDGNKDNYIKTWLENKSEKPDPCEFWFFNQTDDTKRLKIKESDFYIIRSKEKISLPPGIAVYCKAMDESLGEMRIHYAGFVHPEFGWKREDGQEGTPLIFEVRGHNVNVNLKHGERLAKLIFYRMSEEARGNEKIKKIIDEYPRLKKIKELFKDKEDKEDKEDTYKNQELKLSKLFGEWPEYLKFVNEKTGEVEPCKKEGLK